MATIKMQPKGKTPKANTNVPAPITHPDAAGFTLVVGSEHGTFTRGQSLSTYRAIKDYVAGFIDDEAMSEKFTKATGQQVVEKLKTVELAPGMKPDSDEATQLFVQAIADAGFMTLGLDQIPSQKVTEHFLAGTPEATMLSLGAEVTPEMAAELKGSIDAKRTYDAGPLVLAHNLSVLWGDKFEEKLARIPIMGTRRTGSKHDKCSPGYRMPGTDSKTSNLPIYPGPWHHYKDADDKTRNAVVDFFIATPGGREMQKRADYIRSVSSKQGHLEGTPQDMVELKGDNTALGQEIKDLTADVTRHVNRYTNALTFLQARHAFEEKFTSKDKNGVTTSLAVVLYSKDTGEVAFGVEGDADEHARVNDIARKTAPLAIRTRRQWVETVDGKEVHKERDSYSTPFAMGKLNTMFTKGKIWEKPQVTTAADLLAQKRKTPEDKNKATGQASGKQAPKIETVDKLEEYMSETYAFINNKDNIELMKARVRDPSDGGEMASVIRYLYLILKPHAENGAVIKLAKQYDDNAIDALAEAGALDQQQPTDKKEEAA